MTPGLPDSGAELAAEIARFLRESPENRLGDGGVAHFDEPLVAFASASDPLFAEYKRVIGPFHEAQRAVGDLYGVAKVGCGLCQTRVPCESCIPPVPRRGRRTP